MKLFLIAYILLYLITLKCNSADLEKFKEKIIRLKEGSTYRIKIEFYVQRDIVSGLKFIQSAYKGPIRSKK